MTLISQETVQSEILCRAQPLSIMKNEQLKSAEELAKEYWSASQADKAFIPFIKAIQRNAVKHGMTLAAKESNKVWDNRVGVYDQVEAFRLGHGQGCFECSKAIIAARDSLTL